MSHRTYPNNTDEFHLVGDHHELISSHKNVNEAEAALEVITKHGPFNWDFLMIAPPHSSRTSLYNEPTPRR